MKITTLPKLQSKNFVVEKEWLGQFIKINRLCIMGGILSISVEEVDELIEMLTAIKVSLKLK